MSKAAPAAKPRRTARPPSQPSLPSPPVAAPPDVTDVKGIAAHFKNPAGQSMSVGQVRRWIEDGCPVVKKGSPGVSALLSIQAVAAWRADRRVTVSVAEEGAKLKQVQRERIEHEMSVRRGELLERKIWVRLVEEHITNAKARLLALPSAVAQRCTQVAKAEGPAAVRALLDAAIREVLTELAGAVPAPNGHP